MSRYRLTDTTTGEIIKEYPRLPAPNEVSRSDLQEPSQVFIVRPYGYRYRIDRVRHYFADVWRAERYRSTVGWHHYQRRKRCRQALLSEVAWALGIIVLLGGAGAYYHVLGACSH